VEERVSTPDGVAVVGFCSGADNGLFVAARDPRVSRLVLFDPTVHRTRGFDRRRRARRLTSPRSWWNVLSGRSLALELKDRMAVDAERPPGFYGLLTQSPEETDRRVAQLVSRGVPILYVLSSGTHGYCNGPEQIEESLPTGFDPAHVRVVWAPDMDHILSTARQRRALADAVLEHLSGDPGPAGG
jgi:dienelactone hydrolase